MKILLVAINTKYIHSNLAVYSLKAYAEKNISDEIKDVCNIEIAEYTINQHQDMMLRDIYKHEPDVVGFSCYIWNISFVNELAVELKKILPDTKIWLGGPEVSYDAENFLVENPAVDLIMCGEGEMVFRELAEAMSYGILDNDSMKKIPGISFTDEKRDVYTSSVRKCVNLDSIPFVYDDLEPFKNKILYYESSRGCPFSCSYCLSSIDKSLRFRSLAVVKDEIKRFIDMRVSQVKFTDRTFNCKHWHAREIWRCIIDNDEGYTNFHFEIAGDMLELEDFEMFKEMRPGLIQLEIGVQTTNPQTLREILRHTDMGKLRINTEKIRSFGNIHQHLDLIAGLPYEDMSSFIKSFNGVYEMQPNKLQLGFLKVMKGTFMKENAEEYQLIYQDRPPFEVLSTKWLSYEDIIMLKQVEEMVEVYYNSGQFTNALTFIQKSFASPFDMYCRLGEYYSKNGLMELNHTRIARYEILLNFVAHENVTEAILERLRDLLTYDLYLMDNVRNRPKFCGDDKVLQQEASDFYYAESKKCRYLRGYDSYDKRQIRKMTHLERMGGKLWLFDYINRNPVTNHASVYDVTEAIMEE